MERVGIRVADARNDVPVVARQAGERQRRARADDVQATLRVERVREAEQVVLVCAPAVVEDEEALRFARRRALTVDERAHAKSMLRA